MYRLRKRNFRWYQFSLRTLFVLVTLCAIACSWLGVRLKQARREREIAAEFQKLGGEVGWSRSKGLYWLQTLLTANPSEHVESISLTFCRRLVGDAEIADLHELYWLNDISLNATSITDKGLANVKGLYRLKELQLDNTRVTDTGLESLKDLTKLEFVSLSNTQITDAGLEKLQRLKGLKGLQVLCTKVTSRAVDEFRKALPDCDVCW
jgi:hypothetical protein